MEDLVWGEQYVSGIFQCSLFTLAFDGWIYCVSILVCFEFNLRGDSPASGFLDSVISSTLMV
jgi:hypothetical protein